jgi:glycosyltransferase involved in cell wall biosynthesis
MARNLFSRLCDGFVSNTEAGLVMNKVQEIRGVRYWILPNAVPEDSSPEVILPAAPPERLVILMLGNIKVLTKGYDIAAKVARALLDRGLQFELRIAGRPDELNELEVMCRQLGVESAVTFFGEVSSPERFLSQGHLFLLLSRYEGMPNTLLEALNVGLPAIATDVGDLRILKQRGAPFELIPIENVATAVEAVESAIARWSDTRMAAARGRKWVQENFSEAECRKVLRQILTEVLGA